MEEFQNIVNKTHSGKNGRDPFPFPYPHGKEKCKCCYGTGVQTNKQTGLREKCPCCAGTGYWEEKPKKIWI